MGSIRITNVSQGRLVVNSVKLVLLPGNPVVKDESLASDSDIQELEGMRKITVEYVDSPVRSVGGKPPSQTNEGKGSDNRPQGTEKPQGGGKPSGHGKYGNKPRPGKTTPKKTAPQSKQEGQTDQQAAARARQEEELNSEANRMGKTAVIMDRGEVKRQPMGPGLNSHGDPIVPQGVQAEEGEEGEKDSPFVTV